MGPLKDGVLFHKGCFKCWICGTRLSLKTYHNNRNDTQDLEVITLFSIDRSHIENVSGILRRPRPDPRAP